MNSKKIIIVGSGVSAWSAAALLRKQLPVELVDIEVVEDKHDDSIWAESSRSQLLNFHELIGLGEKNVLLETTMGFSLGVEFDKWSGADQSCFVAEGVYGAAYKNVDFQSLYIKNRHLGNEKSFDSYSINAVAAKLRRFGHPVQDSTSIYSLIKYGLNFSVTEYTQVLRNHAISLGVKHVKANCDNVKISIENGFIEAIILSTGECKTADLFIDGTGEASILLGRALGIENDVHDLERIYNRVITGERALSSGAKPAGLLKLEDDACIKFIATERQEFISYYFSTDAMSELDAKNKLSNLGVTDLQTKNYKYQRKTQFWVKNCIAIGAAAINVPDVVISPLQLMRNSLVRFLDFTANFNDENSVRREYNKLATIEYERLNELTELAFYLGRYQSTSLRNYFNKNSLSELAQHKLGLFANMARHAVTELDFFTPAEWASFFIGNGILPKAYDTKADVINQDEVIMFLNKMNVAINEYAMRMPLHSSYISSKAR